MSKQKTSTVVLFDNSYTTSAEHECIVDSILLPALQSLRGLKSEGIEPLPNLRQDMWGVIQVSNAEDPAADEIVHHPVTSDFSELGRNLKNLSFNGSDCLPSSIISAIESSASMFEEMSRLRQNEKVSNNLLLVIGSDIPVELDDVMGSMLNKLISDFEISMSYISPYQLLRLPTLLGISTEAISEIYDRSGRLIQYHLKAISFSPSKPAEPPVSKSSVENMIKQPRSVETPGTVASGAHPSSMPDYANTSIQTPPQAQTHVPQIIMQIPDATPQTQPQPIVMPGQKQPEIVWNGRIQWKEKSNANVTRTYNINLYVDPANQRSHRTDSSKWPQESQVQFIPQDLITPVKEYLTDANYLRCIFQPPLAPNDPLMEKLLSRNVGCISFQMPSLRLVILIYSKKTQITSAIIPNKQDECTAKLRETIKHRQQFNPPAHNPQGAPPQMDQHQNPQQPLSAMASLAASGGNVSGGIGTAGVTQMVRTIPNPGGYNWQQSQRPQSQMGGHQMVGQMGGQQSGGMHMGNTAGHMQGGMSHQHMVSQSPHMQQRMIMTPQMAGSNATYVTQTPPANQMMQTNQMGQPINQMMGQGQQRGVPMSHMGGQRIATPMTHNMMAGGGGGAQMMQSTNQPQMQSGQIQSGQAPMWANSNQQNIYRQPNAGQNPDQMNPDFF